MKQVTVGATGLRVSAVGLGTKMWGQQTDGDDAAAAISAFVGEGGSLVDTSPAYGGGLAERILAEVLHDVIPRELLVLCGSSGLHLRAGAPALVDCSRRALLAQLDSSLRELSTDHLDIWQVAAWDRQTPVTEVAATLRYAIDTGRTRYVGVSGFAGWQVATLAAALAPQQLASAATNYSLIDRRADAELLPAARHHGVGLLAQAPLAGGILTGKYRDGVPADSRVAGEERGTGLRTQFGERTTRIVEALGTAAGGLATSPLTVALAWLRDRPGVASTIVGPRDSAQLTGILAEADVELPSAIAAALDDISI